LRRNPTRRLAIITAAAATFAALAAPALAQGDYPNKPIRIVVHYPAGGTTDQLAGSKFQHIPYAGGAPLVTAFAGGQVHMAFVTGLDGAAMVQAGRIRYLAVGSPRRTDVLPGLPAIAEDVPGFSSVVWFGVLAPRAVPDEIVAKVNAAIVKAVARPDVRKLFTDRNVEPRSSTTEQMEATIRGELEKWAPVIKKANIKE
jgi:tripartite-type tricarboxylate transporter receptor subunit TctC